MTNYDELDYEVLKKRGFLREKEPGLFTLRTRMPAGNYRPAHLSTLAAVAEKFGRGVIHATVRQGMEIPFIRYEDLDTVEEMVHSSGIRTGTSGARLRATTACPGNNWCKRGLVDTFRLFDRIEERGIVCAMDLPHKFKIVVSGCPNACTRAQQSEIGIHGVIETRDGTKRTAYAVYLGGCGGRNHREGFKLQKVFSEDEVLGLIERVVVFFRDHAKPRQRLGSLIEETGRDRFLRQIGL
ncbi:MAG: hypothetical protein MJA29_02440 [Candidatus Omnitrophica bacterium]|nr:hypothetical protein [Candidatus Omnitrophota bacterium]